MRVFLTREGLKGILRWTQLGMFAISVSLLAYCGFVLIDSWMFQHAATREIERDLAGRQTARGEADNVGSPSGPAASPRVVTESTVGRLQVPRIGLSVIVIEGISKASLQRAVGHIPGTSLPGQAGNVGIAGHRDTFFRALRHIRQDDFITIATPLADYGYRVVSVKIVSPSDIAVLDSTRNQILTLVTCYPFYFVGSAPNRFIVRAERVP
ncbi:MAG: class D sortase [Bryobacteraceae bacterium]|nr:class D sortase [Bryobacteraceae bacterium]